MNATPDVLTVILLMLAIWRISYFLAHEDAPFKLMKRLRNANDLGGLLSCIYCVSIWVAVAVLVLWWYQPLIIYPFALSGGALMAHRYTGG